MVISGTIRTLIGITAAGVILLFAAISLAEARTAQRREGGSDSRPRHSLDDVHDGDTVVVVETSGRAALEEGAHRVSEPPRVPGPRRDENARAERAEPADDEVLPRSARQPEPTGARSGD